MVEDTRPSTDDPAEDSTEEETKEEPKSIAKAAKAVLSKEDRIITSFCKQTGYEEDDILEVNADTRTVVTSNGGKYQLTGKGGVRTLSGPPTPNEAEEAAAAQV